MKFLGDESLEAPIVDRLRDEGYDVTYISETQPGASDPAVLRKAARESRILITNDKDFAELTFLRRQASAGIVLLRLPRFRSATKAARLLEVIRGQGTQLRRVMMVVEEHAARRRPFPRRS